MQGYQLLRFWKLTPAHRDLARDQTGRIESDRRVLEIDEGAEHQARRNERHDGECDFRNHQRALQTTSPRTLNR